MHNSQEIIGRVGKDPEIRHFDNGNLVANFSVASTFKYKNRTTGEQVEETEWFNCAVYNRQAEIAEKYVKKGHVISVEGRTRTRKYTNQHGEERYATEVILNRLTLLPQREATAQGSNTPPPAQDYQPAQNHEPAQQSSGGTVGEMDDLPF